MDSVKDAESKLYIACMICIVFMICEVVGGIYAHSLAILTDAAHLMSDLAGFMISIFCLWLARSQKSTHSMSFGFKRAEVIGALMSVSLIWGLTVTLLIHAVDRAWLILIDSPDVVPVNGEMMFFLAFLGVGCNLLMMKVRFFA
jgi:zinc transporter 2